MERRAALKNIGLTLGYTVATPTLLSIMQSCQTDKGLDWMPEYFTPDEGNMIAHLVDLMLPKTDTPAATEVQVHAFVDRFVNEVLDEPGKGFVKTITQKFMSKALSASGKTEGSKLNPTDLEPILAASLKVSKQQEEQYQKAQADYFETVIAGGTAELPEDAACYAFANNLRDMAIMGYKTSEYVGEEVLAYAPIPGEYISCGDVEELTGGKAWSL